MARAQGPLASAPPLCHVLKAVAGPRAGVLAGIGGGRWEEGPGPMNDFAAGPLDAEACGEIEGQHHLQLDLLQALRRAVETAADGERLAEIAETLLAFTKMHFASEELLMRLNTYDGYAAHAHAHAQAIERMEEMCKRAQSGEDAWTRRSLVQLEQWLTLHIETSDRAFAEFLTTAGEPS
jgi:hemerythrin